MMPPIADHDAYTADMRQSIGDKMFFWPHLRGKVDLWVDFGCADGALLRTLYDLCGPTEVVGYDMDLEMLRRASLALPYASYTPSWESVWNKVRRTRESGHRSCLILSSVLHETLSEGDVAWRWKMIADAGFDFIVIRDMAVREATTHRAVDNFIFRMTPQLHKQVADFRRANSLDAQLFTQADLIHFLLKYRYVDNWEREVAENYLPLTAEDYIALGTGDSAYRLTYFEHGSLPWLVDRIYEDLGYRLTEPTHVKLILQRT